MAKLSARECERAIPGESTERDRVLGDGDGLFLRIQSSGTKMWVIEYEFQLRRRKYTIGVFDTAGAAGESITAWLQHGRLSLAQARGIAGHWKSDRMAGRDPIAEWESRLATERAELAATLRAISAEAVRPTVQDVIAQFLAKHMHGKKSAAAIQYRMDRLARWVSKPYPHINNLQAIQTVMKLHHMFLATRALPICNPGIRALRQFAIVTKMSIFPTRIYRRDP